MTGTLENSNGKLLIYVSSFTSHEKRLKSVSTATMKMAKLLKLNFEVISFGEKIAPIYAIIKTVMKNSFQSTVIRAQKPTYKRFIRL